MGAIAGAAIGAASDVATTNMQVQSQREANAANIQMNRETNQANAENVAATNKANAENVAATNKANFEIAKMSNEYNEWMLERQIEQEWDMWNAQNEYNSASSQRQRLEDAGLNPYMMMNGGSAGTASAMSSPSAQPAVTPTMQSAQQMPAQAVPGHVEPVDWSSLSGLRGIATNFYDLLSASEDVKGKALDNFGKEIDNEYKAQMYMANLYKIIGEGKSSRSSASLADSQAALNNIRQGFEDAILSSELKMRKTDILYRTLQSHGQVIANLQQYEWLKALPTQIRQQIQAKAVEINNMKLNGQLTQAQINTEVNKAVTEFYKGAREQLGFQLDSETFGAQKHRIVTDLVNAILSAGDNPLGMMSRFYFGSKVNEEGLPPEYSPEYWK